MKATAMMTCAICKNEMLGVELKIGDNNVHVKCLHISRCIGCFKRMTSIPESKLIVDDSGKIVHLYCSEDARCNTCNGKFEKDQKRRIDGEYYVHKNCVQTCFLCGTPMMVPKSTWMQIGNFYVHGVCFPYCECGEVVVDPETFPIRAFKRYERPLYITRTAREQCFALIRANKRSKRLDKDSLETVINIMLNSFPTTLQAERERHGVDFLQTCTPDNCVYVRSNCNVCGGSFSWTLLDYKSCHEFSCSKISNLIYQTSRACFPEATVIERGWDCDMAILLYEQFERYGKQMSGDQKSVYMMNVANIGLLLAMKK